MRQSGPTVAALPTSPHLPTVPKFRTLENPIERAVILSAGSRLTVRLEHLARRSGPLAQAESASTLEAVKRAHVVRVLEETNWIVGGPRGAAARLGMKRPTLQSFMKRLAIARRF